MQQPAGTGITHSEYNASGTEPLHFLQMWIEPAQRGTEPRYQQRAFPRDKGLRIDFAYASPALRGRVTGVSVDRDERRGKGASDHVPVVVRLGV